MFRLGPTFLVVSLAATAGCLSDKSDSKLVESSPFHPGNPVIQRSRATFAPASTELAARVDTMGRKILAANPQTGLRPLFTTIGAPQPEIFHYGTSELNVTEGLVKQCKTDGELAAVLCHELGKMVSEREAMAGPQARTPFREPPQEVRIGNDNAGGFGPADQTHMAELAKFEKDHRPRNAPPPLPPDPQALARGYLMKSGFNEKDLEGIKPILEAAAANSSFEKQLTPSNKKWNGQWAGTGQTPPATPSKLLPPA